MKTWIKKHWLSALAIVVALGPIAPFNLPTVYYQLLNWVVAGAALKTAWHANKQGKEALAWFFVALAVIFNPVAPLYVLQNTWRVLDLVAAGCFITSFFLL